MQKISTAQTLAIASCLLWIFSLNSACKKKSDNQSSPPADTATNKSEDACKTIGLKLAQAAISRPETVKASELVINSFEPSTLSYNVSDGKLKLTRFKVSVSDKTSYVRWRACPIDGGECFPSNNAEDWLISSFYDDFIPNLPAQSLKVFAQACTEFPANPKEPCGKVFTNVYKPDHLIDKTFIPLLMEIIHTDLGLWEEVKALKTAAEKFIEKANLYVSDLKGNSQENQAFNQIYAIANNIINLGVSEIWRYLQINASYMQNLYADLEDQKGLSLAANSKTDCPDTISKIADNKSNQTPDDLLSTIFGGNKNSNEENPFSNIVSDEKNQEPATASEQKDQQPSTNTNSAVADTPSKEGDEVEDPPANEERNDIRKTTGLWLVGVAVVGMGGSLAYFYFKNKDLWKAEKINRQFQTEIKRIEEPDIQKRGNMIADLAKKYKTQLPPSFDIMMQADGQVPIRTKVSSLANPEIDDVIKRGLAAADSPVSVVVDSAKGRPAESKNMYKTVGIVVLASFLATVGVYMWSSAELASSEPSQSIKEFLATIKDIQSAIEILLERRQKAVAAVVAAKGPEL